MRVRTQVRVNLLEHDARGSIEGEVGDAGSEHGEGDAGEAVLGGEPQRRARRRADAPRAGRLVSHRGGVDHEPRRKPPAPGKRCLPHGQGSVTAHVLVALLLDFRSAAAGDRARHSRSEHEMVVRGIDDRVTFEDGEVNLARRGCARPSVRYAPYSSGCCSARQSTI